MGRRKEHKVRAKEGVKNWRLFRYVRVGALGGGVLGWLLQHVFEVAFPTQA